MKSPDDFARVPLAHRPTPLEPMANLTRHLGGPALHVKRDDCTGLAFGGNKVRQLEFYLGDALARDATAVVITGATQSNFVRCAAAACAKLGLRCHVQLEERVAGMGTEYHESGNVLLDKLLGATVHTYPVGEDEAGADRALDERAATLRAAGERPYVIHLSGDHPPLGALGYVAAAGELLAQAADAGMDPHTIVLASGSASTHAGMLVGLRAAGAAARVVGVCVRRPVAVQRDRVRRYVRATERLLDARHLVRDDDVLVTDRALGAGYGRVGRDTRDAVVLAARMEGLLLDPVYTGKAFAGMLGLIQDGDFDHRDHVVFLHSGGTPALFAYREALGGDWLSAG